MEAVRFKTLRIHLLRQLGYEAAEETVAVLHRATAVKSTATVRSEIAFPLRGSCQRKLTDEVILSLFSKDNKHLIRLSASLRPTFPSRGRQCLGNYATLSFRHFKLPKLLTMRASNARPYGVDCTSDKNYTIGAWQLRLSRHFVTVTPQLNQPPLSVAPLPPRQRATARASQRLLYSFSA
mgnify:CR=1 FL=1